MSATGGILKASPLRISALASRQTSRTQKGLRSTNAAAARTSHPKSARTRPRILAAPGGKPPATPSSVNQHEAEPVSEVNSSDVKPSKAVSGRKLPANYNATARRVLAIMVALPWAIVTSYILFERVVLGREPKTLIPVYEKPSKTHDEVPRDSTVTPQDSHRDQNEQSLR